MNLTPIDVRIIRLERADVLRQSDDVRAFSRLIIDNEESYPAIREWLAKKVWEGVKSGERVAFIGYANGRPSISAVVKKGDRSKFCHLRIAEELQDEHLGEVFFAMMTTEVRRFASEVHFTLPEHVWADKAQFFKSFNFLSAEKSKVQYRKNEMELRCSASFGSLWAATKRKLPKLSRFFSSSGYTLDIPLLLSIQPKFAEAIFRGKKRYEVRRRFSDTWLGSRAVVVATRPLSALLGEVTINSVKHMAPNVTWELLQGSLGCSKDEFDAYSSGRDKVFVIELTDVSPYLAPVPLAQLRHLLHGNLVVPQSYRRVRESEAWRDAISMAAMLHGGIGSRPANVRQVPAVSLPYQNLNLFAPDHTP